MRWYPKNFGMIAVLLGDDLLYFLEWYNHYSSIWLLFDASSPLVILSITLYQFQHKSPARQQSSRWLLIARIVSRLPRLSCLPFVAYIPAFLTKKKHMLCDAVCQHFTASSQVFLIIPNLCSFRSLTNMISSLTYVGIIPSWHSILPNFYECHSLPRLDGFQLVETLHMKCISQKSICQTESDSVCIRATHAQRINILQLLKGNEPSIVQEFYRFTRR